MADTDVFGILSLLLAAGGAAYLFRARVLSKTARYEMPPSRPPPDSVRTQRTRATVPPKLLRSQSEPPPAKTDAGSPRRMVATLESSESFEAKRRAEAGAEHESVPLTKRSEKNLRANAGDGGRDSSRTADGLAASSAKASAISSAPVSNPVPSTPPAAAKTLTFGVALSSTLATAPKDRDAKIAAAKAAVKKASAAQADSSKETPKPEPAKAKKEIAPVSSKTPKKVDVPKSSEDPKRAEPKKAEPKKAEPKKPPSSDALPRLEVEDDEDVEPTFVGKVNKRREIQPSVQRIVFDEGAEAPPPATLAKMAAFAIAQTDPGKRRKQNEDSYLALDKHALYVVADGMGGHRGGQHASKLAIATMSSAFESNRFEAAAHPNLPTRASELARAIQMANSAIFEEARQNPELNGMGTTLCAACFDANYRRMYIGHVGDSRCYRLRDGVMKQMTTDHTMADYGVTGPEGSHLSRALGVWPTVPIDIVMAEPKIGDLYMVCSDGLTKMLPHETIATQLLHEDDSKAAIDRLVFFANAHGGKDNITIILVRIVAPGWKPTPK